MATPKTLQTVCATFNAADLNSGKVTLPSGATVLYILPGQTKPDPDREGKVRSIHNQNGYAAAKGWAQDKDENTFKVDGNIGWTLALVYEDQPLPLNPPSPAEVYRENINDALTEALTEAHHDATEAGAEGKMLTMFLMGAFRNTVKGVKVPKDVSEAEAKAIVSEEHKKVLTVLGV